MRNGFIFKDRHSSDFGVTVRTKSRPILPSVKENIVDLPYRDGGYDFSKANPFGREFYNDRIFTVTFNIYADNLAEMQRNLSLLSLLHHKHLFSQRLPDHQYKSADFHCHPCKLSN